MIQNSYQVGIYCRLSKDDNNGNSESMSIANQKQLLMDYVARKRWDLSGIYVDDGYTGTNFDRPDFQRLLRDVNDERINCVITKDLSRLGRNYAMTGYYTEEYFLERNVRFIAINDNVDTMAGENDFAAFHNVINEFYPKEISRKVRQVKRANAEKGYFQGGFSPYGYAQSPDNGHKLVINPETAPIVVRVFDRFSKGENCRMMADDLNKDGIPSPMRYHQIKTGRSYGHSDVSKKVWTSATLYRILKNPVYRGMMVQGKRSTISFKSQKRVLRNEADWYVVPDTHEPIIDDVLWDAVASITSKPKGQKKTGYRSIHEGKRLSKFSGIIYCKDCGARMTATKNNDRMVYRCSRYISSGAQTCRSHSIREVYVLQSIQKDLEQFILLSEEERFDMASQVISTALSDSSSPARLLKDELQQCTKRVDELSKISRSLYEDKVKGIVSEPEFVEMSNDYKLDKRRCEDRVRIITAQLEQMEAVDSAAGKWVKLVADYLTFEQIDREMIQELVEKVEVSYARDSCSYTKCSYNIDITYRIIGPAEAANAAAAGFSEDKEKAQHAG